MAKPGQEDADLIDPAKNSVIMKKGAATFNSSDSFAMIRGKHIGSTFLGTMQVSENGDIANFMIPGKLVRGMGGAMDLVGSKANVCVLTLHTDKNGNSKIKKSCTLPLTGKNCVKKIITELAVFEVHVDGLLLTEIAEGITLEELRSKTEADFKIADNLKTF